MASQTSLVLSSLNALKIIFKVQPNTIHGGAHIDKIWKGFQLKVIFFRSQMMLIRLQTNLSLNRTQNTTAICQKRYFLNEPAGSEDECSVTVERIWVPEDLDECLAIIGPSPHRWLSQCLFLPQIMAYKLISSCSQLHKHMHTHMHTHIPNSL